MAKKNEDNGIWNNRTRDGAPVVILGSDFRNSDGTPSNVAYVGYFISVMGKEIVQTWCADGRVCPRIGCDAGTDLVLLETIGNGE